MSFAWNVLPPDIHVAHLFHLLFDKMSTYQRGLAGNCFYFLKCNHSLSLSILLFCFTYLHSAYYQMTYYQFTCLFTDYFLCYGKLRKAKNFTNLITTVSSVSRTLIICWWLNEWTSKIVSNSGPGWNLRSVIFKLLLSYISFLLTNLLLLSLVLTDKYTYIYNICLHMCIYVLTYAYAYTHTHKYTHLHTHAYTHTHILTHTNISLWVVRIINPLSSCFSVSKWCLKLEKEDSSQVSSYHSMALHLWCLLLVYNMCKSIWRIVKSYSNMRLNHYHHYHQQQVILWVSVTIFFISIHGFRKIAERNFFFFFWYHLWAEIKHEKFQAKKIISLKDLTKYKVL